MGFEDEQMKNFTLRRYLSSKNGIFGNLSCGPFLYLQTLEHAFANIPNSWTPALPDGEYICKIGTHTLDHGQVIQAYEVQNVPGHTGILFHIGNYNMDSNGCILLGEDKELEANPPLITGSRIAFNCFMNFLNGDPEFNLLVATSKRDFK